MPKVTGISIGDKYGKLTVVEIKMKRVGKAMYHGAVCVCECGGITHLRINHIVNGRAKSCGCLIGSGKRLHGMSNTPEFSVYNSMLKRVKTTKPATAKYYLWKGIKVCEKWKGVEGFKNFLSDMGKRPTSNHSIERKDGNKDYCPENCYWATTSQQSWNKSTSLRIEYNGKIFTLGELCFQEKANLRLVRSRLQKGWCINDALKIPKIPKGYDFNFVTNTIIAQKITGTKIGRTIKFGKESKNLTDWAVQMGTSVSTLHKRLNKYKWSIKKNINNAS